jgi:DNA invertase Pin-like site-specific DNA recombinase
MVGRSELDVPRSDGSGERAAEYVRMSTDHQRYSTENQSEAIRKYATERGFVIVRTYADEGRSGLNFEGRAGLKALIGDVQSGKADYQAVLVYDISRWGRFQDADESAYYEYVCRRAGIRVVYCAEPFENDGTPVAVIMKSVKRAMAGEYSRELSTKVFIGQCHLVELGFRQGGPPGYGLRRAVVDANRCPKGELACGQRKSYPTDRIVLSPGPPEEIQVVRSIYDMFVRGRQTELCIARVLNKQGVHTADGRDWSKSTIQQILTNEKYIGNNIYNRLSFKLRKKRVRNPESKWVRGSGAFEPIINTDLFAKASEIFAQRREARETSHILDQLRALYMAKGRLSGELINEQRGMPSKDVYRRRFGTLPRAYALAGYKPHSKGRYFATHGVLRDRFPKIVGEIVSGLHSVGATVEQSAEDDVLRINGEFTALLLLAYCRKTRAGYYRWHLCFDARPSPDVTIVVRLAVDPERIFDCYLFPSIDLPSNRAYHADGNAFNFDAYRVDSLSALYALAQRSAIPVVASFGESPCAPSK